MNSTADTDDSRPMPAAASVELDAAAPPSGAPPPRLRVLDLGLTVLAGGLCLVAAIHGLGVFLGPARMAGMMKGGDPPGLILLFTVFFAVVVIAVWVGVLRHGADASALLGLRPVARRWWWLAPLCILLLSVVLDEGLLRLLRVFGIDLTPETAHVIVRLATSAALALAATVAIGLLGPFAEELLFRGLIYGYVEGRFGPRAAWAVSSILFALAHVEPAHVLLVLPIGILLGWIRVRSGSLWPCIVAHMANNTLMVWWAYLDR